MQQINITFKERGATLAKEVIPIEAIPDRGDRVRLPGVRQGYVCVGPVTWVYGKRGLLRAVVPLTKPTRRRRSA